MTADKPGTTVLLVEPAGHVQPNEFETELQAAARAGLAVVERTGDPAQSSSTVEEAVARVLRAYGFAYSTVTDFARLRG